VPSAMIPGITVRPHHRGPGANAGRPARHQPATRPAIFVTCRLGVLKTNNASGTGREGAVSQVETGTSTLKVGRCAWPSWSSAARNGRVVGLPAPQPTSDEQPGLRPARAAGATVDEAAVGSDGAGVAVGRTGVADPASVRDEPHVQPIALRRLEQRQVAVVRFLCGDLRWHQPDPLGRRPRRWS
jgi:hypothetical protein